MKIGYVIAVHNRAKEIQYAIRCIFKQTVLPQYLSIVDDASTDNTYNTIQKIFTEKPAEIECTIQTIKKQNNPSMVKQKAVELLPEVDIIINIDSDDFLSLNYTDIAIKTFNKNPTVSIGYPDLLHFVTDGTEDTAKMPNIIQHQFFKVQEYNKEDYKKQHYIASCSAMRAKTFWEVGGWENTQLYDSHLWVKMIVAGYKAKRMPGTIFFYRQHPQQLSKQRPPHLRQQGMNDINKIWAKENT